MTFKESWHDSEGITVVDLRSVPRNFLLSLCRYLSTHVSLFVVSGNENLAFDALSDRVRRQILSVLGEGGELTVAEIAERVDAVGRTTVSSHLRILRTSGVVSERRDGRRRLYCLDTDGAMRDAFRYLQVLLQEGVRLDTSAADESDSSREWLPGTG